MQHLLVGFFWLLWRGPMTLAAVAIAILGLGFWLQISQNEDNAERRAAIAAGPPESVMIEAFDREKHMTDRREVVVQAQMSVSNAYRLTLTGDGADKFAYMVPLIGASASNDKVVYGVALYHDRGFTFDDISPDLMMTGLADFGDFGPISNINGRVRSLGDWEEMTVDAFADQGLTRASNFVVVWPYLEGREAALAPTEVSMFGVFSKIAGAFGLLALLKLVFRRKPDETPESNEPEPMTTPVQPTNAAPLWKQRSGLVDQDAFQPDPVDFEPAQFEPPEPSMAVHYDTLPSQPRRTLGVRKLLIGIVGGLFVLGLFSTVSNLTSMNDGTSGPVHVSSVEEIAATTAADIIVPDADPNRHWTDVDVTPVVEWFVAEFFLAVSGDVAAQLNLGMIVGGLFVAMFLIRYFFVMRRALRPRTTARFDSMGIN